jgi:hypothetical protein
MYTDESAQGGEAGRVRAMQAAARGRITADAAKLLKERYDALVGLRAPWVTLWEEIAKYVSPRRAPGLNGSITLPTTEGDARLFDTTAGHSAMVLANGCLAWMSPQETAWFAYSADESLNDDEQVKRWLNKCTFTTREALARSNFYTAIHEFYLDRSTFGTGCIYIEPGKKRRINAQCWPIGTYVIDEDEEGQVDTVIREFVLTPRTAVMKFGASNVSETIRKKAEKGGSDALERIKFLHFIYPREWEDRRYGSALPEDLPIACVYMESDTQHVCKVSGYDENPVMVSRYLEWGSNMGARYGWSPAIMALPDARQVNFLQKMLDILAEKAAFPPVLAPGEMEGEIDANAAGVTYFDQSIAANLPREWMTAGRYDVGKDRVIEKQEAIRKAFHVDLFQMFSDIDKQMTAREVSERSSEKLIQFSPTFARLTTELFNGMLERLFGMGLRGGWFLDPPEALIKDMGDGTGYIAPPQVQYSSRIALALRALPTMGLYRTLELMGVMAPMNPSVVDNLDFDKALRMAALSEAMPDEIIRTQDDTDAMRAAQAAEAQRQQQMVEAAGAADAAAKLGGVPADSPVGKVLDDQMNPETPGGGGYP